jgi:hypothetical protein
LYRRYAKKYPSRRLAGKGKDDWEAIRTTLVANDFVQRMASFDCDKDFSTGCEHVAELVTEELIDPDAPEDDGGGGGGSGGGKKPIVSSIPKGNTKTTKLNAKLAARSPFGGGAAGEKKKAPPAKHSPRKSTTSSAGLSKLNPVDP